LLGAGTGALAAPGLASLIAGKDGVEISDQREPSLWTNELPPFPARPQFEGEREVDLAIVGAGYSGLSCAYYAKRFRPDISVVVLDSHQIGSGASSRNSGAVYAKYVGHEDPRMPERGLARLRTFIDTEEVDCDFSPAATLMMASSESDASRAESELQAGERWVTAEELRERLGSNYYYGATESPGYYKIHPAKLVAGHANAALGVGAELFEHSPVMNITSGKPALLQTPKGRIRAKNVFIATNAYTPRLGVLEYKMFPLHQYSFATRKLSPGEVASLGLDHWDMRFEHRVLPVTFSLTPSGHFFVRIVLGYAAHDSAQWQDIEGAQRLARRIFEQRYPAIADIGLAHGWQGVTGHTAMMRQIAGPICDGNIHVSVAYNGLGIMPAHNNGYLTACRITGREDPDLESLSGVSGQIPMPGDFYRSMALKPLMRLMAPV